MKHKILIVDHDKDTAEHMQKFFSDHNDEITVLTSNRGDTGLELAWKENPSLIVLNKQLPDLSGWEVMGILKKNEPTRYIPLIMLGDYNKKNDDDEIRALDLGADDYLHKPIDPKIFLARTKVALRHFSQASQVEHEEEEIVRSGNIILNMTTHLAYIGLKKLTLTPKEFALLYLLIKKKNKVLNRVFLSETIWDHEYSTTSKTIDRHVANLRKKLSTEGRRIRTIPTVGYKFIED
ncbi:MAG: response regulator transcription factor [Elusimicrobiota bacterium]